MFIDKELAPNYSSLEAYDMVIVLFATDNTDIGTIHIYGRDHELKELTAIAKASFIAEYAVESDGIDAAKGFEVLSVAR